MEVFIGTSGWSYKWNKDKSLDWFLENSGLDAVELNASFYMFPFPNMVKSWAKKGQEIRWSIKVNQWITHRKKFSECKELWDKFKRKFKTMDKFIDFYLFQAPPKFEDYEKVIELAKYTGLGKRFAFEVRNREWLESEEKFKELKKKITLVSIDSPDFHSKIFRDKVVYLRMHGKDNWYQHNYSDKELKEIVGKIKGVKPKKVYVFFNNNHDMLNNAQTMKELF